MARISRGYSITKEQDEHIDQIHEEAELKAEKEVEEEKKRLLHLMIKKQLD